MNLSLKNTLHKSRYALEISDSLDPQVLVLLLALTLAMAMVLAHEVWWTKKVKG